MGIIRRARLEEGPDYHDDGMVHRVADVCARCRREFLRSSHCATCNFNPATYLNGDILRASLMRVNAQLDHAQRKQEEEISYTTSGGLIVITIVIFVLVFLFGAGPLRGQELAGYTLVPYYEPYPVSKGTAGHRALRVAVAAMACVSDLDGDGSRNDMDYAIYFCLAYPGAQIVWTWDIEDWTRTRPKPYVRVLTWDGWAVFDPGNGQEIHLDPWAEMDVYGLEELYEELWKEDSDG